MIPGAPEPDDSQSSGLPTPEATPVESSLASPPASLETAAGLWGARLAAFFVLFLGGLTLTQVSKIGTGAGFIVIGPRIFPMIVGIGLLGLGFFLLLRSTVVPDVDFITDVAAESAATHWPTTLLAMLSLVVYALLLAPLGYALATGLFFPVAARILGSKHLLRDIFVGLVMGFTIYLVFTQVLGVRLPAGLLTGIL